MKQLNEILPKTTESKSYDIPFVEKQCKWKNESIGSMNKVDGIECTVCKNKGYVYSVENGELYSSECKCMSKRKSVRYAAKSGMNELLKHTVNDFKTDEEWQKEIKQMAISYVSSDSRSWFCLLGQSGAGKTMLCSAIAKTLISKGLETRYVVWNTFVKEMKAEMTNIAENIYPFQKVDVLYIDDLFKGTHTATDITIAFDLINYRYNNRLITLVTSELSTNELIDIDSAVIGRIKEMCGDYFVEIGKDKNKNYRFKK